jgi:hypothetical protein
VSPPPARGTPLAGALARLAPGPLLVRVVVFLAAAVAVVSAVPAPVRGTMGLPALLLVGVLPALLPAGRTVTLVASLAILGWFVATTTYQEPVSTPRLLIVAGAVYLLHSSAALAAVLPVDAMVPPGVLRRWLVRAVIRLVAGELLAAGLLATAALGPHGTTMYALIGALALTAGLAWLMVLMRRP